MVQSNGPEGDSRSRIEKIMNKGQPFGEFVNKGRDGYGFIPVKCKCCYCEAQRSAESMKRALENRTKPSLVTSITLKTRAFLCSLPWKWKHYLGVNKARKWLFPWEIQPIQLDWVSWREGTKEIVGHADIEGEMGDRWVRLFNAQSKGRIAMKIALARESVKWWRIKHAAYRHARNILQETSNKSK